MSDLGVSSIILSSGWFAKLILLILLGFSLTTVSITIDRWRYFRGARRHVDSFRELFKTGGLVNLSSVVDELDDGPMSRLAEAGIDEYEVTFARRRQVGGATGGDEERRIGLANVQRCLNVATDDELARAERRLGFLATSGSVSPFFGLLGTVWGVMTSFVAMGMQSSASLAVVAPGIAEALITTVAGLAVAIPSVIFFNLFQRRMRWLQDELRAFSSDLVNAFSRELIS